MKELTSPAREILEHLLQHPDACDTFEGIAQWWLLEQHIRIWLPRLEKAIEELVAQGLLQATCSADGVIRYRGVSAALTAAGAPRRKVSSPRPVRSGNRRTTAAERPRNLPPT